MIKSGFTSAKAWNMIFGDGRRVRKYICVPLKTSYRNSKDIPYMCAIGRILMIFDPGLMMCPNAFSAKSILDQSARYGINTPFELLVVPLV